MDGAPFLDGDDLGGACVALCEDGAACLEGEAAVRSSFCSASHHFDKIGVVLGLVSGGIRVVCASCDGGGVQLGCGAIRCPVEIEGAAGRILLQRAPAYKYRIACVDRIHASVQILHLSPGGIRPDRSCMDSDRLTVWLRHGGKWYST